MNYWANNSRKTNIHYKQKLFIYLYSNEVDSTNANNNFQLISAYTKHLTYIIL